MTGKGDVFMKKTIALFLALVLLLPLAACGGGTTGSGRSFSAIRQEAQKTWYPYDLSQYVELPEWRGVVASFDDPTVCTEEEIDEAIFQVMLTYASFAPKDGAAELYDLVRCEFYMYFGEELLDDQTQNDHEIILGQSSLDELDQAISQQMIGCVPGDLCVAPYTFPDSAYRYGDLAGKTVRLVAEVTGVFSPTVPECDEAFIRELPEGGFETMEAFREDIKKDILEKKKDLQIRAVWKTFYAGASVLAYPEAEIKQHEEEYLSYYREFADENELDLDAYLREYFNSSLEKFEQEARAYAETVVANDMIFTQLSRIMGTTLTKEEYEAGVLAYFEVEKGQFDTPEEYVAHYGEVILYVNLVWDKTLRAMAEEAIPADGAPDPAAN